jgi:hypothetical protein
LTKASNNYKTKRTVVYLAAEKADDKIEMKTI